MQTIRLVDKVGEYRAGSVLSVDDASAASLIARELAESVDSEPEFDPAEHTVAEVLAYLAEASNAEQHRVIVAERRGKARSTVLGT